MLNLLKWLEYKKRNTKFLNLANSLKNGMETNKVKEILGEPTHSTKPDFGRATWMYSRGLYYGLSFSSSAYIGNPFCLSIKFQNGIYVEHHLTFFPKNDPSVQEWDRKQHSNHPDFLKLCRESFDDLSKKGFEIREEKDRDGGQIFELAGNNLRLTLSYYPPNMLRAEIGPNAIGTMRDRRNLFEVLKIIGHPLAPTNKIPTWVKMLADAVNSHLTKLQDETALRLKQHGPWRT